MTARTAKSNPNQNGRADHSATPFGLDESRIRDVSTDQVATDVPPHDLEAERCVLGACLLDTSVIDHVQLVFGTSDVFHSPRHRIIWFVMLALHESGSGVDPMLLRSALERRGELEDAGGVSVLRGLMEVIHRPDYALDHARIVRDKFDLRRAGEIGRELVRLSMTPGAVPSEIVTQCEASFASLSEGQTSRRTFEGLDAAELESFSAQEPDWLVQDLFTSDEPLLVGARSKGCKTLQLVDLTVALASGTPWMGTFEVSKKRKVLFVSGEANVRRMSRHIGNACRVRGLGFGDLRGIARVETYDFPSLPSPDDLRAIALTVKRHGIEVVILDPLYRGMAGVDAAQLNEMGSAIKNFQAACAPACVILSHHVVKSAAREYGTPPSLEDMTGAGIAESCGQWWLVGRNEKYAWDGMHDLCVSYGGREGQAGGKRIVFDERQWVFVVEDMHDYIVTADEERQRQQAAKKSDAESLKVNQARAKILKACRNIKVPQARTRIRDASGQSGVTFGAAFADLVDEQTLLIRPYRDSRNHTVPEGYILAEFAGEYDQSWEGK